MKSLLFAFLFLAILAPGSNARAQATTRVYWTHDFPAAISSATPTGADRQIFPGDTYSPYTPHSIALDPFKHKLYWSDIADRSLRRANLDGTEPEVIVQLSANDEILGLSLDPFRDKLYWTDHELANIMRSNSNGSQVETLYHVPSALPDLREIEVDPFGEKLYWINKNNLYWSNLDGTNPQLFVPLSVPFEDISIDFVHQKLYWTVFGLNSRIARANLDGTNVENVLFGSSVVRPDGIVVDGLAGKMYWTEVNGSRIRRANLDGTGIETILTGVSQGRRITINGSPVPEPTSFALLVGAVSTGAAMRRRRAGKEAGRRW